MKRMGMIAVAVILWAVPSAGQVVCTQMGAFTDCSGSGGLSSTQVDLGNHQGVIITDRATTPYTILTPPTSMRPIEPLPTLDPLPTLQAPSTAPSTSTPLPMLVPMGDGPILMLGQ